MVPRPRPVSGPASGPALVSPADAIANTAAIIDKAFLIFIFARSVGHCLNRKISIRMDTIGPPVRTAGRIHCNDPYSAMHSQYLWFLQKFLKFGNPDGRFAG